MRSASSAASRTGVSVMIEQFIGSPSPALIVVSLVPDCSARTASNAAYALPDSPNESPGPTCPTSTCASRFSYID